MQAATLQDLSGGRGILGLGVANADIVRLVASGERVEYDGEIHTVHGFRLSWRPTFPRVPIYFAGLGEQMTRQAGRLAGGGLVHPADPTKIREIVGRGR